MKYCFFVGVFLKKEQMTASLDGAALKFQLTILAFILPVRIRVQDALWHLLVICVSYVESVSQHSTSKLIIIHQLIRQKTLVAGYATALIDNLPYRI